MASFFMICLITILVSFQASEAKTTPTDASSTQLQTYIVQLQVPDHIPHLLSNKQERESWYASLLSQVVSDHVSSRLVHSYHHVFHGFAVRLTFDELVALQNLEGILSAWPDTVEYVHTTHSPQFMGLNTSVGGLWEKADYGSGIIIGVVDTGINADNHLSFQGEGSPPGEWKGKCQAPIKCNNKLIGAKSLVGGSPVDDTGHGSHIAGIAAGAMVRNASVGGEGSGTASGVAPRAQLAIYKVCTVTKGCPGSAILAAFEAAIEDRVDVISVSLGPKYGAERLERDTKAIGAFAAIKKGIFVSVSAGNAGPSPRTVGNEAPWYLTVGASTTDRDITAGIRSVLERGDGVLERLNGTSYGNPQAPTVARFSSRGPTKYSKGIIKPDIIGPGVQIISASHKGMEAFTFLSGTSMACPHLSAAAELIKKMHPDWSPAAIKSALMTTAYQNNLSKGPIQATEYYITDTATPYSMGAGHVDVVKATDPGLVFDIQPDDYISYLCSVGFYNSRQVSLIVSSKVDCAKVGKTSLNLPSVFFDLYGKETVTVPRTLTNVGSDASEVYKVEIQNSAPNRFNISVDPQELQFTDLNIQKKYEITFTRKDRRVLSGMFIASMVWRSDKHVVRSPIMVVFDP